MITIAEELGNTNVILFVHGLTGSIDTWKSPEDDLFHQFLLEDDFIRSNFDVAFFTYHSKIINLIDNAKNTVRSIFPSLFRSKKSKNLSIVDIAKELTTDARFRLANYQNVVVIAHSMGGIITKKFILNELANTGGTKVKLFLSLAVPHNGSNVANFGGLLSNNIQITDLKPLSNETSKLNDEWLKASNKPVMKYYHGLYDSIVPENSAIAIDYEKQDVISCSHDHTSISKPLDNTDTVIISSKQFINEVISGIQTKENIRYHRLKDELDFDDQYFVLKLIVADIHSSTVKHAKELFLNADYAQKLYSSDANLKKLIALYDKIRFLYKNEYDNYLAGELTSMELIANIHKEIIAQDKGYLDSTLPNIDQVIKIGMLHQLANKNDEDIWWSKDKSLGDVEELKSKP